MGRRIAIGIGVGHIMGMPLLEGARSDAVRFIEWAQALGYETQAFIDRDDAAVSSAQIRTFIRALVDSDEEFERLIIYFSGHGLARPDTDLWLLSDFASDGDECISVEMSRRGARQHPFGQVALIADACRTAAPPQQQANGRNLFPNPPAARIIERQPKLDIFFASRLGYVAQEAGDPGKSFGVFSQCLFSALKGEEPRAVDDGRSPAVVSSQTLADWLEMEVPLRSGMIPGASVQYVDVTAGWGRPNDWYLQLDASRRPPAPIVPSHRPPDRGLIHLEFGTKSPLVLRPQASAGQQARQLRQARERERRKVSNELAGIIAAASRPTDFEGRSIRIVGAGVHRVTCPPGYRCWMEPGDSGETYIRVQRGAPPLAIILENRCVIGAQSLRHFHATILVDGGDVVSVNYAAASGSRFYAPAIYNEAALESGAYWSALQALGSLPEPGELLQLARRVRVGKHADPSLGIIAAHAYDRGSLQTGADGFDSVDSIAWFFAERNGFVPFDVALLSSTPLPPYNEGAEYRSGDARSRAHVAGVFPLMTRGWGLMDPEVGPFGENLGKLRAGLRHGPWTCFEPEAGARFARIVGGGGF